MRFQPIDVDNTIAIVEDGEVDCYVRPGSEIVHVCLNISFTKDALDFFSLSPSIQRAIGAALLSEAARALREQVET